jgi:long-chain acyl-CoA synthetase
MPTPSGAARFTVALGDARPAEGKRLSQSAIYRSYVAKDGFPTIDVTTLYDSFRQACERYSGQPCLGHRPVDAESGKPGPYVFQTYKEVADKVAAVASGLSARGLKRGDRVGVYGANCVEWMLALQVREGIGWWRGGGRSFRSRLHPRALKRGAAD